MRSFSLLSIVIPVYNDAAPLARVLPEVYQTLMELQAQFEIIVVDDGSKDNIVGCIQDFANSHETLNLKLIRLSRNFGKEAALSAGLAETQGDVVICMDSDGQHPLTLLDRMINLWRSGIDMVAGVQATRPHEPLWLKAAKSLFYSLLYSFLQEDKHYVVPKNAGDFRLMDRKVVNALLSLPERKRFMKGLYAWVGFQTVLIPFEANQRIEGKSKFKLSHLFELGVTAITSFSLKPLRWVSRLGIIISFLAILYGLFICINAMCWGEGLPGWSTLAASMMLLSGLQLVCLGVISEYLGRIFEEVKQRPLYVIDKVYHSTELTNSNKKKL